MNVRSRFGVRFTSIPSTFFQLLESAYTAPA